MSGHTPGPWLAEFTSCGKQDDGCRGGWKIVGPYHSEPHGYHNSSDASLIAAAPDLLAACKRVLGHLDGSTGEIDAVALLQAAIAKAEGRS